MSFPQENQQVQISQKHETHFSKQFSCIALPQQKNPNLHSIQSKYSCQLQKSESRAQQHKYRHSFKQTQSLDYKSYENSQIYENDQMTDCESQGILHPKRQKYSLNYLKQAYQRLQQQVKELEYSLDLQFNISKDIYISLLNSLDLQPKQKQNLLKNQDNGKNHAKSCCRIYQAGCSIQRCQTAFKALKQIISTKVVKPIHHLEQRHLSLLLQLQISKENKNQSAFINTELQENIQKLRYLLNGKQDLLAFQVNTLAHDLLAECSNDRNAQQKWSASKSKRNQQVAHVSAKQQIEIQYYLPKRQNMRALFEIENSQGDTACQKGRSAQTKNQASHGFSQDKKSSPSQQYQRLRSVKRQFCKESLKLKLLQKDIFLKLKQVVQWVQLYQVGQSFNESNRSHQYKKKLNELCCKSGMYSQKSEVTKGKCNFSSASILTQHQSLQEKTGKLIMKQSKEQQKLLEQIKFFQKQILKIQENRSLNYAKSQLLKQKIKAKLMPFRQRE